MRGLHLRPLHTLYPPSSSFYKQARGKHLGSHCRFLHLPMRKTNFSKHLLVPIYSETKMLLLLCRVIFKFKTQLLFSPPGLFPLCPCVPTMNVIPQTSSIFPLGCGLSWSSLKEARQAGQRTPGVLLSLIPSARPVFFTWILKILKIEVRSQLVVPAREILHQLELYPRPLHISRAEFYLGWTLSYNDQSLASALIHRWVKPSAPPPRPQL